MLDQTPRLRKYWSTVLDLKIAPMPETTTLRTFDQILLPPPPTLPPPPPSPHALAISSVAVEAEDPSTISTSTTIDIAVVAEHKSFPATTMTTTTTTIATAATVIAELAAKAACNFHANAAVTVDAGTPRPPHRHHPRIFSNQVYHHHRAYRRRRHLYTPGGIVYCWCQ